MGGWTQTAAHFACVHATAGFHRLAAGWAKHSQVERRPAERKALELNRFPEGWEKQQVFY